MGNKIKVGIGIAVVVAALGTLFLSQTDLLKGTIRLTSATCKAPYHVIAKDGRCVWSCGQGTQPDNKSDECVCKSKYIQTGKDKFGRRVCSPGLTPLSLEPVPTPAPLPTPAPIPTPPPGTPTPPPATSPVNTTLALDPNSSFSGGNVTPGAIEVKIGSLVLSSGSVAGVNVTSITLHQIGTTPKTEITNLKLKMPAADGSVQQFGSTVAALNADGRATFTASPAHTIAVSGMSLIDIYADVAPSCVNGSYMRMNVPSRGVVAYDINTANDISPVSSLDLQSMTCAIGTLSATRNGAGPAAPHIKPEPGITKIASINLSAGSAEDIRIQMVKFISTGSLRLSSAKLFANRVDGSSYQVGSAVYVPADGTIQFSGIADLTVPRDSRMTLDLFANVHPSYSCSPEQTTKLSVQINDILGSGNITGTSLSAPVAQIDFPRVTCP